ncbi:hypothetical protein F5Y19DRAFT_156999 [Xylariaceae sp. FL1651]|nr:hypothetical protein F5Y19DRAFT_156999 [Xylariaceae sp. FL1651]
MAIHPTRVPYRVLVRNYYCSKTNSLVQSPNVDLKARLPSVIVRSIDQDYAGDPRIIDSATQLREDLDKKVYHDSAHGVYISPTSRLNNFPLWVCLEQSDRCRDNEIYVFNLSTFECSANAIETICWVPSHEAANGDLYTVIGRPLKQGFEKELRLPVIMQRICLPRQAKFRLLQFSSLSRLMKLDPIRQAAFFDQQYMHIRKGYCILHTITLNKTEYLSSSAPPRHLLGTFDEDLEIPKFCVSTYNSDDDSLFLSDEDLIETPFHEQQSGVRGQSIKGFCRCPCRYPDLGPTCLNPLPLHRHVTDDQRPLGSSHQNHCVYAAHREDRCVISSSENPHEHCPRDNMHSTTTRSSPSQIENQGAEDTPGANAPIAIQAEIEQTQGLEEFLSPALERLPDVPCFRDSDKLFDHLEILPLNVDVYCPDSRPISPPPESILYPQVDLEELDCLPSTILDSAVMQGPVWNPRVDSNAFMTPEPPVISK